MSQNNSNLGKLSINHSSNFIQFCSTFSNLGPLKLCHVKAKDLSQKEIYSENMQNMNECWKNSLKSKIRITGWDESSPYTFFDAFSCILGTNDVTKNVIYADFTYGY